MTTKETPAFVFDEQSDLPLWVQLRDRMAYLINSGFYKPGEKLPTVRKAYMGLERDGYVTTVRGSGVFVRDTDDLPRHDSHVESLVQEFVESCLEEGMTYDDIPKLVSKCVRKMKRDHEEKH